MAAQKQQSFHLSDRVDFFQDELRYIVRDEVVTHASNPASKRYSYLLLLRTKQAICQPLRKARHHFQSVTLAAPVAFGNDRLTSLLNVRYLALMRGELTSVKQAYQLPVGSQATLRGWVRSRRDSKGITFIELNDGSRFKSMQVVVDAGVIPDDVLKQITTGSSIAATGVLVESPAKGQAVEVKVASIDLYGTADAATYPLQKKGHTLEFLRDISHLRVRSNTFGAAFRVRNALTHAIHTFFQERDFIYVQTPIITTSDCEGAGQMFNVTSLNMNKAPRHADGKVDWQQDFFGRPAYLTVSGQ